MCPSNASRIAAAVLLAMCGCSAAIAEQPKRTIVRDSYLVAPKNFDDLWDSSTLVAKVAVEKSETFGISTTGAPNVFTRYYAHVERVFKGDAEPGATITFAQAGGRLETSDYVVNDGEPRLLLPGHSYVIFAATRGQIHALSLTYNHFGAFEIANARVIPLAGGDVSNEWRNMSES